MEVASDHNEHQLRVDLNESVIFQKYNNYINFLLMILLKLIIVE